MMATSVLTLSIMEMLPRSEEVSRLHVYYYGLICTIVSATVASWASMVADRWVPTLFSLSPPLGAES